MPLTNVDHHYMRYKREDVPPPTAEHHVIAMIEDVEETLEAPTRREAMEHLRKTMVGDL